MCGQERSSGNPELETKPGFRMSLMFSTTFVGRSRIPVGQAHKRFQGQAELLSRREEINEIHFHGRRVSQNEAWVSASDSCDIPP